VAQALEFLKDRAGRHFDPRLIVLFERELPGLLELKERFRDAEDDAVHSLGWLDVQT
jgi:response regulator RpfG family c-di-GMP phosphodiesterase